MQSVSLDGAWEFRQVGGDEWMPATVPGTNFTDLLANGTIEDPFVSDNEKRTDPVIDADWEYRRTFDAPAELLACDRIFLECDGLDTLATIRLNGVDVARTDNMFMPHVIDVGERLQAGENEIRIVFESPRSFIRRFEGSEPTHSPRHSLQGGTYVRKAICQFGWDWGPKLPPAGVWRPIRLTGRNVGRFDELHVRQTHRAGKVGVSVRAVVERWDAAPVRVRFELTDPNGVVQQVDKTIAAGREETTLRIAVDDPQLWWPNGYGDQPLYDVTVSLLDADGKAVDVDRRRIGLRKLKLKQKSDRFGESFTFVVNDVEIFAKGANWIPADSFPTRVDDGQYRRLLTDAAAAHMNMLRIWGGGFYEDERFYDLCDEIGLLVWQDFMFACAVYRGDDEYFENFRREAVSNIRRLRHRACVALWCGNNEMEQGWVEWRWTERYPESAKKNYDRLFHHLLPEWTAAEDPDRTYWPSSPSSGEPHFVEPNAEDRGDGHFWGVWHKRRPFTDYRLHYFRFQSEFGFQSLPSMETIASFAGPQDWNMTSYVMEHHQRSGSGNGLIVYYLTETFRIPKSFEALVYVSQVLQAEAIRYGVEHWRRARERCSGTLYWQLNDCWPVASWSSIDYFGRWKALHYAARRFYAPVLLSAEETETAVDLHVTNDLRETWTGKAHWRLETLDGTVIDEGSRAVKAPAGSSAKLVSLDFAAKLDDDTRRNAVFVYELTNAAGERAGGGMVSFVPPKHLDLGDPDLSAELDDGGDVWRVTVSAEKVARFVEVRLRDLDVVLSDNFFDLPAGTSRTVTVPKPEGLSAEEMRYRLRVRSLWDSF